MRSGGLSSSRITGLHRYYAPIRHLPEPLASLTGRTLTLPGATPKHHPDRLPLFRWFSFPCVLPPLPRWDPSVAFCSVYRGRRPSPLLWRVGSHINIFRACTVFTLHCGPHGSLIPLRDLFWKYFSSFVTSCTAPSVSGWSNIASRIFHPGNPNSLSRHTQ
jgi:hypothetical protein